MNYRCYDFLFREPPCMVLPAVAAIPSGIAPEDLPNQLAGSLPVPQQPTLPAWQEPVS